MEFYPQIDRRNDENFFTLFFENGNETVKQRYPQIRSKQDVLDVMEQEYQSGRPEERVNWFKENNSTLEKIANTLSEVIKEDWTGINAINILVGVCPVCPRFIQTNTFCVYANTNDGNIWRICAHEMAHFLYFKKLKRLLNQEDFNTEFPGFGWLLSEILVVPIVNDPRIQEIINEKELGYYSFSGVPEKTAQKVQTMWNPDKMLEIHEKAYELLKDYVH